MLASQSPCQRVTNEDINGPLRQYFPQGHRPEPPQPQGPGRLEVRRGSDPLVPAGSMRS